MRILIVYYSTYGHIHRMAEAVAEGARIIEFGLQHPAVRGICFQPVAHTGRHLPFDPMDRVTLSEVVERIEEQTAGLFVKSDFIPLPCPHPGCQSITYAYLDDGSVTPLPRVLNVDEYLDYITNRAWPDPSNDLKRALEALWSASAVPGTEATATDFTCAICNVDLPISGSDLAKRVFGISIKRFMDAWTFDVERVMKCCVHFLNPDGRMIPFCAYNNLGYREAVREAMMRAYPLRKAVEADGKP